MSFKPMNKNRFVPSFETLESREMMSVTSITLNAAGLLKVVTDGGNNSVNISSQALTASLGGSTAASSSLAPVSGLSMSTTGVQATASVNAGSGTTNLAAGTIVVKDFTRTTNNVWTFARSSVKSIEVDSGAGNDTIVSNAAVPTKVVAGEGNNFIQTGAGNDNITVGNGSNTILTGDGDDVVYAIGAGNNYIDGGNGNDTIFGGSGNNTIHGGAGNDYLADLPAITNPTNASSLFGEDGNDIINAANRNDVVDGGAGIDSLTLPGNTWIVRNGENVTINVPHVAFPNESGVGSAFASASRLLQANGFSAQHLVIQQDDSAYGATPSELANRLAQIKKDTVLKYGVSLASILETGKPVLIAFGGSFKGWVVVNGYNATTNTYQVLEGGTQISLSAVDLFWLNNASGAHFSGAMIY